MSSQKKGDLLMPDCLSCGRPIPPDDSGSTVFNCPNCGEVKIFRCSACREFVNPYECPKCAFEGP